MATSLHLTYHVAPEMLGEVIQETATRLAERHEQVSPQAALYCEKVGGFQCGSCTHSTPVNATHGRCAIVATMVHLEEGCCVMWSPDVRQLHLYREPKTDAV